MAVSMRDLDPAFQGAGQKAGMEIWRIENFRPVPIPNSSYGKFFTGDAYIIMKTTASKNGAFRHDIHYWLGKDTSQDEAGTAAIKTVELDASLGGRAVQYREVQGHETEKFLSYFRPCIIPQEGGVASGFKHTEINEREHETRLFVCKGKHVVHVKEVPFSRSSLNHDDIFILDTKSKIFQFSGSNSSIQERAKALEVVQYIKDTYHDGKCEVATVDDGKLMADAEAGEFWGLFGGFAPLPRKAASDGDRNIDAFPPKLLCVNNGQSLPVEADSLTRELLETNKCYLLDCGIEIFVWTGRNTSLDERKSASATAEALLCDPGRPKSHMIRIIEGFETVMFRSKFVMWPQTTEVTVSEDGRGKVAALLKRQGLNVKGLMKAAPVKEEPQPYIDCTGNLQVWRVNGKEKTLLPPSDQSKFYSGDCHIFQYTYSGDDKEEYLVGTWFGNKSIEEERTATISLASKMVESLKSQAVQARLYEGREPIQFFSIFQSFIVHKGGVSSGYKNFLAENGIPDETYAEDGIALFRVQGSGPENMQAIQVEPLLASALQDTDNQHFVLLSDSCVPLHNFDYVHSYLMERNISFIDCFEDPGPHGTARYSKHMLPEIQKEEWRKGAQWFSVKRQHALIILADSLYYTKFKLYCKPGMDNGRNCYADEHYLPTLFHMVDPTGIANWSVTHVDWSEGKWHPKTYRAKDVTHDLLKNITSIDESYHVTSDEKRVVTHKTCLWNGMRRPCYLFARKFDPQAVDALMAIFSNFTKI